MAWSGWSSLRGPTVSLNPSTSAVNSPCKGRGYFSNSKLVSGSGVLQEKFIWGDSSQSYLLGLSELTVQHNPQLFFLGIE